MIFNESRRLHGFINYNILDCFIYLEYIFMTFKIGINWHLKFREEIKYLKEELELTQMHLNRAERKLKKYENNNIRPTGNGKNNNVVKLSGRVHPTGD